MTEQVSETDQEHSTEYLRLSVLYKNIKLVLGRTNQSEISRQGQEKRFASAGCWCDIKDIDHRWINNVDAIIELRDVVSTVTHRPTGFERTIVTRAKSDAF
jgi:hypothetical protein